MNKSKVIPEYLHKRVISIPLYGGKLVVILTNSTEQLQKYIPSCHDESPYAHAYYINWKGHQGFTVVLNFDRENVKITHGAITHEAFHIMRFIARERGFDADFDKDEEPCAYLIDWVTDEIYKTMKKYNKKVV